MISHPFPYRLIRSNRKTLAIQVSVSGQVTVRAPRTMSDSTIHRFLSQKESWVLEHISRAASGSLWASSTMMTLCSGKMGRFP